MKKLGWFLLPEKAMAYDKQKHAAFGFGLGIAFSSISLEIGLSLLFASIIGVLLSGVVGYLIELSQKNQKGRHYDIKDVFATMLGATVSILIFATLVFLKSQA